MKDYFLFEDEVLLAAPLDRVFDFFSRARNLEEMTPAFLKFQVITPEPIEMREGLFIDYKLRVRGVPMRWHSEITEWNPPYSFTDTQRRGPYRELVHRHTFSAEGDGRTRMRDEVRYKVLGGKWVNRFIVRPDVERVFAYRRTIMQERFGLAG